MNKRLFFLIFFIIFNLTGVFSQTWVKISCGGEFSIGIKSDGSLWVWGINGNGQMGNTISGFQKAPARLGLDRDWSDISAGGFHCLALKKNGTLYTWGSSTVGQTGLGIISQAINNPTQVGNDSDWIFISAGYASSYAIKKSGRAYSWGLNNYGQLGDSSSINTSIPKIIKSNITFKEISAGGLFAIAIAKNGTLWGWGYNKSDQLNFDTIPKSEIPIQIGNDSNWTSISAGFQFCVGIKKDSSIWSWGYNGDGQLGQGISQLNSKMSRIGKSNKWIFVASGASFAFAIDKFNSLYSWGSNLDGEIGLVKLQNKNIPTKVDNSTDWESISGATGFTDGIYLYGTHSIGLKSNKLSYCGTGTNYTYQLGYDVDTSDIITFNCSLGKSYIQYSNTQLYGIQIFPVPTCNNLYIKIENSNFEVREIKVLNVTGAILMAYKELEGNFQNLDLSHLYPGVYIIQLFSNDLVISKKIIKQ
jgi:alpha-tubulin suppressor-like RCC1 family protein